MTGARKPEQHHPSTATDFQYALWFEGLHARQALIQPVAHLNRRDRKPGKAIVPARCVKSRINRPLDFARHLVFVKVVVDRAPLLLPAALHLLVQRRFDVEPVWRDVGHQALARLVVVDHRHDTLLDQWVLVQKGFNFTQFNAATAYFHLVIDAAQVFEQPIRRPAGQITSAIHRGAAVRCKRIGDERALRDLNIIKIAAAHRDTGNTQLAHRARCAQPVGVVQHIKTHIGDGPADGDTRQLLCRRLCHQVMGDIIGAFRGAIGVEQGDMRKQRKPTPAEHHRQGLAGRQHDPQAGETRRVSTLRQTHQQLQERGHTLQYCDLTGLARLQE
ncbi:hypothetical protein ALP92_05117 [Pseudomonas syringae pv. primulae]|uniref:Uncharacterized protein n=1 Tax=Pseudomonas syringae pv. primulae TaxID=251707 RepID=A0A3M4RWI7_9PSED|nr:hypothetical protein ALP92_05117 [Pseudomonas syringae pv. primulae]